MTARAERKSRFAAAEAALALATADSITVKLASGTSVTIPLDGKTADHTATAATAGAVTVGSQIKAGTPEMAMYGFAVFYALCLIINWWFYLRKNAYIKNP